MESHRISESSPVTFARLNHIVIEGNLDRMEDIPMQTACTRFGTIHTVEEGDTLYSLGKEYNVKVSSIIYANPCTSIYQLRPGDQICIPKMCNS